jgi:hypothetical protein
LFDRAFGQGRWQEGVRTLGGRLGRWLGGGAVDREGGGEEVDKAVRNYSPEFARIPNKSAPRGGFVGDSRE